MDSPCIKQTVCKVLKIFQCGKYLVAYVLKCQTVWIPIRPGQNVGSDLGPNWKGLSAGDNVMLIFNAKLNISVQLQLIITFEVSNSLDQNPVEKAQVICVSLWSKQLDPHPPGKK